ncbi:MAG: DUF481 domain-containing protein [Verrucomicrobia bacterium]|nr:DUF481 domain-containing protein [Verrucomicrobiota bacterium]
MKQSYIIRGGRRVLLAAAVMCLSAEVVLGQAAAAPPPKTNHWETSAAAGLTLSKGNSDSLLGTLSLQTGRKWAQDEFIAGVSGAYGEQSKVANQEQLSAYMQYNHLFSERLYGGLRVDGLYDKFAGVDYRVKISPMIGYYLIKEARTSLAVEAGPALVMENLKTAPAHSYWGARLAERFEHKLTDTTKIWQSLEYVARVDHWANDYLLTGEAGIDTRIAKGLSLRVVFQDLYNNDPAAGRKKNDMRLISGIAYTF